MNAISNGTTGNIQLIYFGTDEEIIKKIESIFPLDIIDKHTNVTFHGSPKQYKLVFHEYDDLYTSIHFEVSSSCWKEVLFVLVDHFLIKCKELELLKWNSPYLQISDRSLLNTACLPAHLNIGLNSIKCGNFISPTEFLVHYYRPASLGDSISDERRRELFSFLRDTETDHTMLIDFEHDISKCSVRFAALDGNRFQVGKQMKSRGSIYTIQLSYGAIRRITVDFKSSTESPNDSVTRLYFHTKYPCQIRRFSRPPSARHFVADGDRMRCFPISDDVYMSFKDYTAVNESPVICIELTKDTSREVIYEILCRLHVRVGIPIEFTRTRMTYFAVSSYVAMPVQLIGCDNRLSSMENANNYVPLTQDVDDRCKMELLKRNSFALSYLIAALLSRGATVKDQILVTAVARDRFIDHVLSRYDSASSETLDVLERMLTIIDEIGEIPRIIQAFDRLFGFMNKKKGLLQEINKALEKEGYQKVRRVVITPTRTLLLPPELNMGNRVLREFDKNGEGALRVQFRDDSGSNMRLAGFGSFIIGTTIHNSLLHGIYIAGRHFVYLASSNSQMRDHGCYFFDDGDGGYAEKIRRTLGKFDLGNIPKLMSRMGQCFTQSKECGVGLKRDRYSKTFDIIGGKNQNGEPYTFSDGVGKISPDYAEQIANDHNLIDCVPSCFQIRHRGFKGILAVDCTLLARKAWARENGILDTRQRLSANKKNNLDIVFRPSQEKFHGPRTEILEVVKFSAPTPVCLNRPMINVLDQVSEMQGFGIHQRVKTYIHDLLDSQLEKVLDVLMSEESCRERLAEFPRRIGLNRLSPSRGFSLVREPFFRSMMLVSISHTINSQLAKEQIPIPPEYGRCMFGVIDETGLLQYGQVFIQYTNNITLKRPGRSAARNILTGQVLITKNPCTVAGDIRLFEAIDLLPLRHLCDVVVFPHHGPRPHTDEMAGSDLDGDEYSVIWDSKIHFAYNEEPMNFPNAKQRRTDIEDDKLIFEMGKFFVDYIKQDSVGAIANAFLVNSDLYGIKSTVCGRIATKYAQSLDFPKTGHPPENLVRAWTEIKKENDIEYVPPEKAKRWPDYMGKIHEPSYTSPRLVGHIFRRLKQISDVLNIVLASRTYQLREVDEELIYDGWEEYAPQAEITYQAYVAAITTILDTYGISEEAQLFTSCFNGIQTRHGSRARDNYSAFNTAAMVEGKVTEIFKRFRKDYFENFGGYMECTQIDEIYLKSNQGGADRRYCANPSVEMKKQASAYYMVCYSVIKPLSNRILSFPWVAWDILAAIKEQKRGISDKLRCISLEPLSEYMSNFIEQYCIENMCEYLLTIPAVSNDLKVVSAVKRYCRRYIGLDKVMYFALKWAETLEVFTDRLKREHVCLLLIHYGLGFIGSIASKHIDSNFMEITDDLLPENSPDIVDIKNRIGGLGRCFIQFLRYLSARSIEKTEIFNFMKHNLGCFSVLMRGQFLKLHEVATQSLYELVLTNHFTDLRLGVNDACPSAASAPVPKIVEGEVFTIEMPESLEYFDEEVRETLLKHSGVIQLNLRRRREFADRVPVSALGTIESLQKLKDLVEVKPTLSVHEDCKERSDLIALLIFERIRSLFKRD